MSLLEIRNLTVSFGGVAAANAIDMTIDGGEIRGLIGPNGAGKTTLFNAISGLVEPQEGAVRYEGRDITALPAHHRARLGIRRTFQTVQLLGGLTVLENVLVGLDGRIGWGTVAGRREREAADRVASVLDYLGIGGVLFRVVDTLAFAERRYVEVARALVAEPKLLLLDEPAAGLAPSEVEALDRLIVRLNRERGITILLVEHVVSLVMNVCGRITVLDRGAVIADGPPADVAADPAVRTAYLGEAGHAPGR